MRQLTQNARTGQLELLDVPAPAPGEGQVLVRTAYSVMSPGTEKLALDFARKSMIGKARSRPDLVRQVLRKLRQEGPLPTYRAATNRLDAPQALGYSSAGVVEAVGPGVAAFGVDDRVACAGAGYASHAELVVVPENLIARVPDEVRLEHAAFATIGAIAMQGLRIASPTLGELAAVIGLGLIGQVTVQLLRANGCRVLAIDLDESRVKRALDAGAEWGGTPGEDFSSWRDYASGGHGADFAIVTASAPTSAPLALATELCRQKGRISLVGAMPIEVERRALYDKELELRMSTSYGPGRYDRTYEEDGLDYPLAYVRWTENRNLQAFLHLVARGALDPDRLGTEVLPFDEALKAYEDLAKGRSRSLATVFRYPEAPSRERSLRLTTPPAASREPRGAIGVAFIGVGNYAKAVLLPALAGAAELRRAWIVTATGPSARRSAERFGFAACATAPDAVFDDPAVDLVFIATRHDSHAELAARALRAGKAVWLEKPAALSSQQLELLEAAARETGGFLMVGYNRRFSAHAAAIRNAFRDRHGPLSIHYVVSAGPPPVGTWIMDPHAGGGRIVGEACHFIDLCSFLTGSLPVSVSAHGVAGDQEVDDSLTGLLEFADGSSVCLQYLAHASTELPKERFEVSGDGRTMRCENFRETRSLGSRAKPLRTLNQDKGQAEAIRQTLSALRAGAPAPMAIEEVLAVSRASFALLEAARSGTTVRIESDAPTRRP